VDPHPIHPGLFSVYRKGLFLNTPLAILLALCASLAFGGFSVVARKAMNVGTAITAAVVAVLVSIPVYFVLSLFYSDWGKLTLEVTLWFALAGVLTPGIGRTVIYLSIRYLGVGRAMPLSTLSPFMAVVVAFIWLGERPGLIVLGATVCVVGGCILLAMKPERDRVWNRAFLVLPLIHAISIAFATSVRRYSLIMFPDFIIGSTIATIASLPAMLLFLPILPKNERFRIEPGGLKVFIWCGLLNTVAFIFFFAAFQFGEVSIVVPMGYAAPFFSLIFSKVWLKEEEVLTWQKWVGAIVLFFGVVAIALNAK
jgi:drug/metabolite transporter (DMT)-like permease